MTSFVKTGDLYPYTKMASGICLMTSDNTDNIAVERLQPGPLIFPGFLLYQEHHFPCSTMYVLMHSLASIQKFL